jgi:beta-lactamase class A
MTVTGLGTARKATRLPVLALFSGGMVLAALILFGVELSRFAQSRDLLQTDITVAGVPVTGLKLADAVVAWDRAYEQPVTLDYQGSPIVLRPADIGLHVHNELMQAEIQAKLAGANSYWIDFWNYLWRRPTSPVEVSLIADYQEAKLRDYLQNVAERYEQPASAAAFDTQTMTFGAGASGMRLDVEMSLQAIDAALRRPTSRHVKLVMKAEGARNANMQTLAQAIRDFLVTKGVPPEGPGYLASVVVIDLQSGQELTINPDIAYSAMSTIKIPILLNIFRKLDFPPRDDVKWLMGASILCSINSSSNFLIQLSGAGDNESAQLANGLTQVTNTVQVLGAKNTYINAPIYVADKKYQFSVGKPKTTPNPRFDAKPDLYSQTTAEDMAALLQELYDCSEYGSGLMAVFPEGYTQKECKQMIELLSGNIIGRLIELGVPAGTRVAHKNGWGGASGGLSGANVSDAGIIYTPGGTYILSVYIWEEKANEDGLGSLVPWEAIEGVSRVVYNYFNSDNPLLVSRVPENQYGAINCVMPDPAHIELLDLNNINNGRFDTNGHILPDACVDYPACTNAPTNGGSAAPTAAPNTGPTLASTLPPPPPK